MSYQQPPPPYTAPQPGYYQTVSHRKPRRTRLIAGIVGGFVLLCCGGVAVAVFNTGRGPSDEQQSQMPAKQNGTKMTLPTTTAPTAAPEPVTARKPPVKTSYKKLTARQWLKIAKDPDAHSGETVVVYGSVTQFDSATGSSVFRADVGASNQEWSFDYPTNTMLVGDEGQLSDLVQDDEFRAKVIVAGSYSYETQIGGETTVPQLYVSSIKLL
ncbi:hypothetical protein GCM10010435_62710 [Winogradskya consettensis]|uniref:Uncharacterized protein n=1 Tax=Winogradskya consettensis TaxID=113560 RepID=A0A919W042_9ACTN|nr:hypothetical protein [Actinoplanes consettensis]GIM83220.1 hypothetical protein Aco04nite_85430 [Actinoplanes consettensis]